MAACLYTSTVQAAARPTVMVLYFDNNAAGPAYEGLAKGLADMMMTDLAAVPSVQVVEREKLDALLAELKLQRSKYFDGKTAQRLGKGIGAEYAVTGAFLSIEPAVRIDVRLIKVESGAVVKAASVTGRKDDFFKLQVELASKLTDGLSEVVAASDAQQIVASARKNRVGSLDSVIDYGRGIDARDRGDLTAASKHLQKVVRNEPTFALGKSRYSEIMKALYQAKERRDGLLSADESKLLAHADAVLASTPATAPCAIAYRILISQCYLARIRKAVENERPAKAWQQDFRKFMENQAKFVADTKDMPAYPPHTEISDFSPDDENLAKGLGISMPGSTYAMSSPAAVMRETAEVVMFGTGTIHFSNLKPQNMTCPFKLDPAYGQTAVRWLEMALAHVEKFGKHYVERETMRILQELARTLALLGRTEDGIAVLQGGLEAHPKSDEFKDVEKLLRELLEEPPHTWCKTQ
jgi:TolB-like protein